MAQAVETFIYSYNYPFQTLHVTRGSELFSLHKHPIQIRTISLLVKEETLIVLKVNAKSLYTISIIFEFIEGLVPSFSFSSRISFWSAAICSCCSAMI